MLILSVVAAGVEDNGASVAFRGEELEESPRKSGIELHVFAKEVPFKNPIRHYKVCLKYAF